MQASDLKELEILDLLIMDMSLMFFSVNIRRNIVK